MECTEPLIAAAIGGFAALGGQLIATKSSDRSIEQIAVQSCIQRIDTQEAKLREVGERLFGTLGSLIGASVENDQQSFNSAGKEIIRAAFEVNAYASRARPCSPDHRAADTTGNDRKHARAAGNSDPSSIGWLQALAPAVPRADGRVR